MGNLYNSPEFQTGAIRAHARESLKGKWGKAAVIGLVFLLISAVFGGVSSTFDMSGTSYYEEISFGIVAGSLVWAVICAFVMSPIEIGAASSFIMFTDGETPEVKTLFSKFSIILKATGMMVLSGIKVFLWSLLLIVPGIIAAINYSMAPYIMAEDSNVGIVESIEISKKMMKGNKGRYFLLQLSFIGWVILAVLTLGIGCIWLVPYVGTANARFYRLVSNEYLGKTNEPAQPIAEG
jgi:uncharacterized membrane protein